MRCALPSSRRKVFLKKCSNMIELRGTDDANVNFFDNFKWNWQEICALTNLNTFFYSDRFKYYKSNDDRWKNSVRHNLSINPHFRKGSKASQGAGHLWTISSRDSEVNILAWEHVTIFTLLRPFLGSNSLLLLVFVEKTTIGTVFQDGGIGSQTRKWFHIILKRRSHDCSSQYYAKEWEWGITSVAKCCLSYCKCFLITFYDKFIHLVLTFSRMTCNTRPKVIKVIHR